MALSQIGKNATLRSLSLRVGKIGEVSTQLGEPAPFDGAHGLKVVLCYGIGERGDLRGHRRGRRSPMAQYEDYK